MPPKPTKNHQVQKLLLGLNASLNPEGPFRGVVAWPFGALGALLGDPLLGGLLETCFKYLNNISNQSNMTKTRQRGLRVISPELS